jgi:hypothetical protein
MSGGGDGGISGGIGGGVVDWLGHLPGEGVGGDSVGGEKGSASSNTAAAGSVGGRGCDTAIENGPVAKDSEGGEDSLIREVGVEPCGEGDGQDGDLRGGREGGSSRFHPSSATQPCTASLPPFACVLPVGCNQVMVQW